MGKVITPKYRVEYRDQTGWHHECWSGRATDARAEKWRKLRNQSFQLNGVNAHVSKATGIVLHVSHVRVVHQRSGMTVATAQMPTFEVA